MIELKRVEKVYKRGAEDVHALKGVDLHVGRGEFVSITGPSGSGKTTLLHMLGCLDRPTGGTVRVEGAATEGMAEAELVKIRRHTVGFVFQQFYLIPGLSAFDNVSFPLLFARKRPDTGAIASLLDMVGLKGKMGRSPSELSGGEQQRVAIARALVNDPPLILADEPTGNLDTDTGDEIFRILEGLNARGRTVVIVTHNPELANRTGRTVSMRDGLIAGMDGPMAGMTGRPALTY